MPIQSTKTTMIPGLTAPATPDSIAYRLSIDPLFSPAGVDGRATLTMVRFRANADGTDPVKVGDAAVFVLPSVFGAASDRKYTKLAAAIAAVEVAVQELVVANGL